MVANAVEVVASDECEILDNIIGTAHFGVIDGLGNDEADIVEKKEMKADFIFVGTQVGKRVGCNLAGARAKRFDAKHHVAHEV